MLERSGTDGTMRQKTVIFAEPGTDPHRSEGGLMPGDKLMEVNGVNVEDMDRDDVISLIRGAGESVTLKVQPVPELSELTRRSTTGGRLMDLDDAHIVGGTLKRSASQRYCNTAKSESELESEKAWLEAERVWLVHKGGFAAARQLRESESGEPLPEGQVRVKLDYNGDVIEVDEDDVEKTNPPHLEQVEDLSQLRFLNESSVLHVLRQRYAGNLIHTYAGNNIVIINPMTPLNVYSDKVMQYFRGCKPEDMPPHIFAAAQTAYRNMLVSKRDQSLVFIGRSGSGKTINFRYALQYLTMAAGSSNKVLTKDKLNAIATVLEAFGNSRTVMNTNATRFTEIFSLDFDQSGQIASASIQVLMPERSRVVKRPDGDPSFHIFYQLLAGVEGELRRKLHLENLSDGNSFMTPLQRLDDRQMASLNYNRIVAAMTTLDFSKEEMFAIWSVLAAIYHLGVAGATKAGTHKSQFARPHAAQKAASLVGITTEDLSRHTFSSGSITTSRQAFRSPTLQEKTERPVEGMEALEGMAIGLYNEALNAVVALINRSISSTAHTISSILLVDIPGLQNPASCGRTSGATFSDLCHNYVQERLQMLFHDANFTAQSDKYSQENIDCNVEDLAGEVSNPASMVSLIDRPSQTTVVRTSQSDLRDIDRRGLLWLLDEEALFPGSTDQSFLERLYTHYGGREFHTLLKKGNDTQHFILQHLQGTNPVLYSTRGWLRASRENPVTRAAAVMLQESQKEFISKLFLLCRGPVSSTLSGSVVGIEGSQSLRRASSIRRAYTTGTAGIKRKSVCLQVKFQVDGLMEMLRRTRIKFIHCLLPQHNAGLCDLKSGFIGNKNSPEDIFLNIPLLRSQVRGAQILDAVRIHKQGFPEHMAYSEFRRRFALLVPGEHRVTSPVLDERKVMAELIEHIELDKNSYRLGLSQIFFRNGVLSQLEEQRDELLQDSIIRLQSRCRGNLARRKLHQLKLQDMAVRCIQKNVRKFMLIRDWPWWRLLVKVTPLLNVHRTEEELRKKTEELETLRCKVEKLEKERGEFQHNSDRLEARLSEMTADLAEEHSTSVLATEKLEAETSERMRLEKEVEQLQTQTSRMQQNKEQLEMELFYQRAAEMNGDLGSDEEGDDMGIYKQKYNRLKRDLEYMEKRLKTQHDDDLEQLVMLKKQLEKKLADAYEEVDEQRQVVSQWKRKTQKLTGEMNDLRLMLEEQTSRNALLEKKQRKFDTEVQMLQDEIRQERFQKEKSIREKDQVLGEKYTAEQSLSTMKLDMELKDEKLKALTRELDDLTFGGKTDEDVAQLKRHKHELELKVKDQEEELDDLAGQVQLLEQAKLRLEMSVEQMRKEQRKEAQQRDDELEEVRCNAQKKVKALESQLESEHEERTILMREKHELERKMMDLQDQSLRSGDEEVIHKLKKDLKKTKALLRDAQTALEKMRSDGPSKSLLRQLRNQLEDAEFGKTAAMKARQGAEMELQEVQSQLDDALRAKAEVEDRYLQVNRERTDLSSRVEETEEDLAEVMKKYRTTVQQLSVDQITIQDQAQQISELETERGSLREQLAELSTRIEVLEVDATNLHAQKRLELKVKEMESKLELEQTTRHRLENQISRLKENMEKLNVELDNVRSKEVSAADLGRKLQRQLRESKEVCNNLQQRETDATQKKTELEKRIDLLEGENETLRSDLKIAMKRVEDLQTVIQGDVDSDSIGSDSDSDSDNSTSSLDMFTSYHGKGTSSPKFGSLSDKLDQDDRLDLDLSSGRHSPLGAADQSLHSEVNLSQRALDLETPTTNQSQESYA